MNEVRLQPITSNDDEEIRKLIKRWAKAVREEDRAAIRADHDPDILMFDVPLPFLSQGLDAYMTTWEKFFSSWSEKPAFDFHDVDVRVTAGKDVAFATAIGGCADLDRSGKHEEVQFRLIMCLRKIDGRWQVLHEHHLVPAEWI